MVQIFKTIYDNKKNIHATTPLFDMTEEFILNVDYRNKTREFKAELRMMGYTHKIMVLVDDQEIIFEPDEERNYRAVLPENADDQKPPDIELLKAIAAELEAAFK